MFKKGTDIVYVILEERTLAIGTLQSIPMDLTPLVVVADTQVLDLLAIGY